jgi:Undecaprenyl-phosphate glucose phosphotransferase
MSRMDDVESQVQGLRIDRPISISYYTVGLFAAFGDFIAIVATSIFIDLLYQRMVRESAVNLNMAIGTGIVVALLFVVLAKTADLYKLTFIIKYNNHSSKITACWIISILLITLVFFLLQVGSVFSRGSTIAFAVLGLLPLVFLRFLSARTLRYLIAQSALSGRRAVIIGEERELTRLSASSLLINFGLTELARISFDGVLRPDGLSQGELEKLNKAIAVARTRSAEEFVIAFDWKQTEIIERIVGSLRLSPLPVRLLPDQTVRSMFGRVSFSTSGPIPPVELQRAPLTRAERFAKRACDVVLAATALVLLAPLMLISALAIKLDSAGPIIFRQRRTGFDGYTFFINKFRTMSVMEDGPQITQTKPNDVRVTRVGRLLRQSSIDELPQLLNVIRGDMSLVGPRPHALAHDDHYGAMISNYAYRHHVKPGITGWAQVNGWRGETKRMEEMEKRIEFDLWYINNWSVFLDFKIMWRTCFELVQHRAY